MQEQERNIDDLMRTALAGYREQPREEAWQGVRNRLAQDKDRKRPVFMLRWWWILLSLLLLVSAGGIVAYIRSNDPAPAVGKAAPAIAAVQEELDNTVREQPVETVPANNQLSAKIVQPVLQPGSRTTGTNTGKPAKPVAGKQMPQHATHVPAALSLPAEQPLQRQRDRLPVIQQDGHFKDIPVSPAGTAAPRFADIPFFEALAGNIMLRQYPVNEIAPGTVKVAQPLAAELPVHNGWVSLGGAEPLSSQMLPAGRLLTDTPQKAEMSQPVVFIPVPGNETMDAKAGKNKQDEGVTSPPSVANDTAIVPVAGTNATGLEERLTAVPVKAVSSHAINIGVKAGYQSSLKQDNAPKWMVGGIVQYNISNRFAVSLQPAFLSGQAKTGISARERIYYNITSSGIDPSEFRNMAIDPRIPDTVQRSYTYTQTYDSIVVTTLLKDTRMWDVEMPVTLEYNILPWLTVNAGGVAMYSNIIETADERKEYNNLTNTYTETLAPEYVYQKEEPGPFPAPEDIGSIFSYTGDPIGSYKPNTVANSPGFFRYGYSVGVGVQLKKQFLFNVSMQQMSQGGQQFSQENIRRLYTQPYFRVTFGYLFK